MNCPNNYNGGAWSSYAFCVQATKKHLELPVLDHRDLRHIKQCIIKSVHNNYKQFIIKSVHNKYKQCIIN